MMICEMRTRSGASDCYLKKGIYSNQDDWFGILCVWVVFFSCDDEAAVCADCVVYVCVCDFWFWLQLKMGMHEDVL